MPSDTASRILFLTRRYPPSRGGIQTHCHHLYTHLSQLRTVKLIALGRNHLLHLLWFIPSTFVRALLEFLIHRVDVVYFGDGVTSCLATFLRPLTRARFVVTIHGLELTYSVPVLSHLMRWGVARCDHIVTVSENSLSVVLAAGVPQEKASVVYFGIKPLVLPESQNESLRREFEEMHGIRFGQDRILLNYCRQVRRKGLASFLEKGAPLLGEGIKLFVGGSGPELEAMHRIREEKGLQEKVVLMGWLEDETAAMLRKEAGLFLMPNIRVPNDVEGFGIAQLECMYAGLPVVAFAVDALVESVREGGYLIPEDDYEAFVDTVHKHLALSSSEKDALREEAAAYVRREYSWERTTGQYLAIFDDGPERSSS